jgi:hypothetical protein
LIRERIALAEEFLKLVEAARRLRH